MLAAAHRSVKPRDDLAVEETREVADALIEVVRVYEDRVELIWKR